MNKRLEIILGRELDPEEQRHIEWLQGWDYDTRIAAETLFISLYRAGQMDVMNAMKVIISKKESETTI